MSIQQLCEKQGGKGEELFGEMFSYFEANFGENERENFKQYLQTCQQEILAEVKTEIEKAMNELPIAGNSRRVFTQLLNKLK